MLHWTAIENNQYIGNTTSLQLSMNRPLLLHGVKLHLYFSATQLCYRCIDYFSTTVQCQHTARQVHFLAVLQCSSWRRDGNTTTATYYNADAVEYEQNLTYGGVAIIVTTMLPCSSFSYACTLLYTEPRAGHNLGVYNVDSNTKYTQLKKFLDTSKSPTFPSNIAYKANSKHTRRIKQMPPLFWSYQIHRSFRVLIIWMKTGMLWKIAR